MAKATKRTCEEAYTETITCYKNVPNGVTLELSDWEAQALATIFGNVGGDPDYSGRKHAAGMSAALGDAGYTSLTSKFKGLTTGSIYFK